MYKGYLYPKKALRRFIKLLMGTYQNQIDAKNRMIVPSKFREELGSKCVLTRGLDECLILYPMSTWIEQTKNLATLPRTDAEVRAFLRYTYANARDVDIDRQGRVLFPQDLREFGHIEKELVTIGMIDRVEIWSKEVYDSCENGGLLSNEKFAAFNDKYKV